ncbi:MAG TPA: hypothetical protein VI320_31560 [Terracidiphilus sp.]
MRPVRPGREAEPTPEVQLAYLDGLKKLTEAELRTFIEGMSLTEVYRPAGAAPYTPPASSPQYSEFRILDYVRTTRGSGRDEPVGGADTVDELADLYKSLNEQIEAARRENGDPRA